MWKPRVFVGLIMIVVVALLSAGCSDDITRINIKNIRGDTINTGVDSVYIDVDGATEVNLTASFTVSPGQCRADGTRETRFRLPKITLKSKKDGKVIEGAAFDIKVASNLAYSRMEGDSVLVITGDDSDTNVAVRWKGNFNVSLTLIVTVPKGPACPPPAGKPATRLVMDPRTHHFTQVGAERGINFTCFASDNSPVGCPSITLTTSNPGVVSVTSTTPKGIAVGNGSALLKAVLTGNVAVADSGVWTVQTQSPGLPVPSISVINVTACTGFQAVWGPVTVTVGGLPVSGTWTSNSPGVATVSNTGLITLSGNPGNAAVVFTTATGASATVFVNVAVCPPPPPNVTISAPTLSLRSHSTCSTQSSAINASHAGTWTMSPSGLVTLNTTSGQNVVATAVPNASGNVRITVSTPNNGSSFVDLNVNNASCAQSVNVVLTPSSFTLNTGQACTSGLSQVITSNVDIANWSTSSSSGATVVQTGARSATVTGVTGATGTVTISAVPVQQGTSGTATVTLNNTTCVPPTNPTVRVLPDSISLIIGQMGVYTATVTNGMANGTWSSNCAQVSQQPNQSANVALVHVTATRACKGTVVYTLPTGQSGSAIFVGTSGATSCTVIPQNNQTTVVVGQTTQPSANCVYQGMPQQPYWWSRMPNTFTVVGAPNVVIIGGVAYPAGSTATVKAIWAGTTDICAQAAVADPTVFGCLSYTAVAASSSRAVVSPLELGENEMLLPPPPPPGAKVEEVLTFAQWKARQKKELIK